MSFLNPTYLWALLGLAIPIAIHLWSKKEGKTIKIGSIKLLSEADSRQSSSISLNELLLLFLRLSIITLLVLAMAEPQIRRNTTNTPLTYIVEPSLINNEKFSPLIDSLSAKSSIKLLQSGFPEFKADEFEETNFKTPNYWQLAKDMETLRSDSIVVFTNAFVTGLNGKRPVVDKKIEWIILESENPKDQIAKAILKKDKVQLLSILNTSDNLSFKKENISLNNTDINVSRDSIKIITNNQEKQLALEIEEPLSIFVFYESKLAKEATYLEASFNAISKYLDRPIKIKKAQDTSTFDESKDMYLVWLSEKSTLKSASRLLSYKPDNLSNSMIVEGESKNEYYLTNTLNTENSIEERLTEQLLDWLNLHPELEEKIKTLDKRVVSKAELLPIHKEVEETSTYIETLSISKWIWILLGLVLVVERIIASIRKQ